MAFAHKYMNILILNWRDITHPWHGGAEVHLHETAKQLVRRGHTVTLLCGGYAGAKKTESIDGVSVLRYGGTYSIYVLAPIVYLLKLRGTFDLLIDTEHGIPFFTPLFSRTKKICIIHHIHTTLFYSEFNLPFSAIGAWVEKHIVPILYRNVPILTLSESWVTELKHMGFRTVHAIAPGIEENYFTHPQQPLYEQPTILFIGRFRKYKQLNVVLHMMNNIRKRVPDTRLLICGAGQEELRLRKLTTNLKLDDCVEFTGFVSPATKRDLLSQSHVHAMPSQIEGWGLVATEAAACGLPTVAFAVIGLTESVANGISGILTKNKVEFEDAIVSLLSHAKQRASLSASAKTWAKQFSWERAGEETDAWLRSL